ncbi:MAG: hypothetical protein RR376_02245 [Janthinobacterium sp.]
MNAFLHTYLLARCDDTTLVRPALAVAGLLLLLTALLWRRIQWRQRIRDKAAGAPHQDLRQLLQERSATPAAQDSARPLHQAPPQQDRPAAAAEMAPFDQARLDAMFGYDRRLQGEILTLFVSETRDRLAGIAHALRCGRTAPARLLSQEILDGSAAMGLGPLQALAHRAVNAGFADDIEMQRRLHADLLVALDVLSSAVTRLQYLPAQTDNHSDTESLP